MGRKIFWSLCVAIVVAPLMWLAVVFPLAIALDSMPVLRQNLEEVHLVLIAAVGALAATVILVRLGLKSGWPGRRGQLIGWGTGAVISLVLVGLVTAAFTKVRESSKLKAMLPRQPAAAIDQFFLENPHRIFLQYDEIVGPDKYIKAYKATDGEDLRVQFPIRQGWSEPLPVRLPDGTTVRRLEVLAAIGRSGLIVTYPRPQDDQYDSKRVYRLDCGVSFRDWHVVTRPPDPAGREGRDLDGVHTYEFPDGRRFEITYRSGVPDGPFRAYHADGAPWGEATYRKGRVVEAWLITRDGRKFDELKDGEAAQLAVNDSLATASRGVRDSGLQKLGAKDYAGAITDLTRALTINPTDADLHRARADAYRATGNLDGAINDYGAAEGFTPGQLGDYRMPEPLRNLVLARGRQRQQAGDIAGAARDFAAIGKDAGWAAEEMLRNRDLAGAMRVLDLAIAAAPVAELLAARADARRLLAGQQAAAEADYTQAVELARQGKMQLAANQRVLSAHWLYNRGHVRRWLGNFTGAAGDFRAALPSLGTGGIINRSDAALWLFLAQCEAGHRDEAVRELQATDRTHWWPAGQQTARFLLGETTEAELDAAVKESNQDGDRLKAKLLSGLLRRQAGDEAGALDRFRQAARRTSHDEIVVDAAQHEAGQALRTLAERELAGGNSPAAAALLREAVSIRQPAPADLLARYGDARRGAKDPEGAFATYHEALRAVVPGTADALAAELREKIATVNAELEPIRQARTAQRKPPSPAASSPVASLRSSGATKLARNDPAGALTDFARAIEIQPETADLYLLRGDARRRLGKLDDAIADYTTAIGKSKSTALTSTGRYQRAHLRRLRGDLPGAVEDFRLASAPASRLWLFLAASELGPADAARAELAGALDRTPNPPLRGWNAQLAGFLLGRITEEELAAKAEAAGPNLQPTYRFQALFFAAMRRQLAGDRDGALDRLRRALPTAPNSRLLEFERAEARRLVEAADGSTS